MSAAAKAAPEDCGDYSTHGRIREAQRLARDLEGVLEDAEDGAVADELAARGEGLPAGLYSPTPAAQHQHQSETRIKAAPVPERLADAPLSMWIGEAQRLAAEHVTSAELLAAAVDDVERAARLAAQETPDEAPVDVPALIAELKELAADNGKGGLAVAILWAEQKPVEKSAEAVNSWAAVLFHLGKSIRRHAEATLNEIGEESVRSTAHRAHHLAQISRLAANVARVLEQAADGAVDLEAATKSADTEGE